MATYNKVQTTNWKVNLPSDWSEGEQTESGELYFESEDGTKGLYISTWDADIKNRTELETIQSFVETAERATERMSDHHWIVKEKKITKEDHTTAILDWFDPNDNYRMVCKFIVKHFKVINSTFHDYDCEDYAQSKSLFDPLIESIHLIEDHEDV